MKEEKTDMFLLTPLIFNNSQVKDEVTGAYTITISLKEMEKFETNEELEDFLMYNYDEVFFVKEADISAVRYKFYFDKLREIELKKAWQ